MKKLGLALGAGGSRGVAHIGFLKALEEEGIKPALITGSSMGSVVGAGYAAGVSVEKMFEAVRNLKLFDLISPSTKKGGLFDTKKMRNVLAKYIGDIQFSDLHLPFHCMAVDMISQKTVEFSEGSVLDAVVASSSIPSIFRPTEKEGMRLIDGGILDRVPYAEAKRMGADVVVAVDVLGQRQCSEKMPGAIGIVLSTVDIMDNYRTKMLRERDKEMIDLWLEPDLGNMSQYSFKQFDFAHQRGYELGKANVEEIKKILE
ncbi:MAG: patatin-like phospholipase family protein [Clostridia bacterium]|nr:patatin-like phospholipase family protein [Clostridia bacterium]